nr:restriction endonuclease subunit S [Sphaerospermopsis sp. FACHB-1194]
MFGDPVKNPKGWSCKNLGDTCAEIYRYPTFYGFQYQTIGTPVARIGNILLDGRLDPNISNYVFIDPVISKQFPRTILELYDIVMAVRGDGSTAKRIGLVTSNSLVGANISPNLLRFKAKANISHPLFLFHFMISDKGQKLLESYVTRTAKKTITAEGIKKIKIPLPPFSLQKEFAQRVEAVEELKKSHRASLSELDALFASLQHRAFKGEL